MNRGVPPTDRKARTGELTPPGTTCSARAKSSALRPAFDVPEPVIAVLVTAPVSQPVARPAVAGTPSEGSGGQRGGRRRGERAHRAVHRVAVRTDDLGRVGGPVPPEQGPARARVLVADVRAQAWAAGRAPGARTAPGLRAPGVDLGGHLTGAVPPRPGHRS